MTTLPIPFVVAFLLVLLAASNHHKLKETGSGLLFALVLYLNALSMVLIGLRWSRNIVALLPLVATLSVISAALLYLAFRSLGRHGPAFNLARDWMHLVPAIVVATSAVLEPQWAETCLILTKAVYTGLLIRLALQAPASLQLVRLSWLKNSQQALWGAVILQVVGISVDIAITIDFILFDGRHAADLVGFISLVILLLLGYVSVMAGRGQVASEASDLDRTSHIKVDSVAVDTADRHATPLDTRVQGNAGSDQHVSTDNEPDTAQLVDKLNKLLVDDRLYADTELNLQRFARKAGVPPRILSRAINTHTGLNLSQWVNNARIEAVCRLLHDEHMTVSDAMLEAGFLTKSNFNREFRRAKGCSPSEWRKMPKA